MTVLLVSDAELLDLTDAVGTEIQFGALGALPRLKKLKAELMTARNGLVKDASRA
jgi:hypothetical protein